MKDNQHIYEMVRRILAEEFELADDAITRDAKLYQELGLDSIDAVDLFARLQELTGSRINPETFRNVVTVDDAVAAIDALINKPCRSL